jgi:hypothetical protein
MPFKYHSESAQTIYSSKETKKSHRQSCMNKTTAVCPDHLSTISINLGFLPTTRSYAAGYLRRLQVSVQTLDKVANSITGSSQVTYKKS